MLVIKMFMFIFPFIKEMVLGEKTFKEAVFRNKSKVFLIIVISVSIFLNLFTIPRLFVITKNYLELSKKCNKLTDNVNNACVTDNPTNKISTSDEYKTIEPKEIQKKNTTAATSGYMSIKNEFERIHKKESRE